MRSLLKASGASNRKFEHVALLDQWSESLVQVGMQNWHAPRCNNDDPFTDGRMDGEVAYACIYFKRTVQALRGNMHSPLGRHESIKCLCARMPFNVQRYR